MLIGAESGKRERPERPMPNAFSYIAPVVMLALSNVSMTFAWYGHLKFGSKPLWIVVFVS